MTNEEIIGEDDLAYMEKQVRSLRIAYHEETEIHARENLYLQIDYYESMINRLTSRNDEEEYYNDK